MEQQPRVLKGLKGAGRFSATAHGEGNVTVGGAPSFPDVATATPDQIRDLARTSRDPEVLAELTSSPAITEDVLEQLADPAQDTSVRLAVAQTGYAGTADRAAHDPNPLVRAVAACGWDVSEANRNRLRHDRGVQHVLRLISA